MRLSKKLLGFTLIAAMLGLTGARAQETQIEQNDVLTYLEQLITWQRDAAALEPSADTARELIFQDTLRQNSLHVLQSGFKFARAEATQQAVATTDDPAATADEQTPRQRMMARQSETEGRINQINTRLAQLDKMIPASSGTTRAQLTKEQGALQDELKLANAKLELFQTVLANINAASSGESKGFAGKINNLARSIPELNAPKEAKESKDATKAATVAVAAANGDTPATPANSHAVTSILSLTSDIFTVTRKQRELKDFQQETAQLETASRNLIKTLRVAMDTATETPAPEAAVAAEAADADAKPAAAPLTIDQKVAQFKKIAADLVPLGDATLWIGISKRSVEDWQNLLDDQMNVLLRSLLIHTLILAVTLAIPLIISGIVKRAIKRYVGDPKRQRQAQTARRVIAALVILFIVLQNFISDFSSFATFAGFLTAGLAVALQSVLLSLVAHFFFYGRYGVRNGDRVNVGGVTGDILQIGIMRFYIRELQKTDDPEGFLPTGKVVAFPNSILFQPAAFYKYV